MPGGHCLQYVNCHVDFRETKVSFPFLKGRLALETTMGVSEAWKEILKFLRLIYQHSAEVANLYRKNVCEIWKFLCKVHSPFCDVFLIRTL